MANNHLVVTILCDDKPGLVQQVAETIAGAGGNWLESRMSELGGKFAGILRVSVDDEKSSELKQSLQNLSTQGFKILIDDIHQQQSLASGKTLRFDLIGADRVGIVSEIAQAFSEKNINIDELETHCSNAPWSGEPLFEASGNLIAPIDINKDDLLDSLEQIEDKLGLDISLSEEL
jgi:glycine cleavage system regulatory protein